MSANIPPLPPGAVLVPCTVGIDGIDDSLFGWLCMPRSDGRWQAVVKLGGSELNVLRGWLLDKGQSEATPVLAELHSDTNDRDRALFELARDAIGTTSQAIKLAQAVLEGKEKEN